MNDFYHAYDSLKKPTSNLTVAQNVFRYNLEKLIEDYPLPDDFIIKYRAEIHTWWHLFVRATKNLIKHGGCHGYASQWWHQLKNLECEVSLQRYQILTAKKDRYWISELASDDIFTQTTMGQFCHYLHDVHYENIELNSWNQYVKDVHLLLPLDIIPSGKDINLRTSDWPSDVIQDTKMAFYSLCWHKYHGLPVAGEEELLERLPEQVQILYHVEAYQEAWTNLFGVTSPIITQETPLML